MQQYHGAAAFGEVLLVLEADVFEVKGEFMGHGVGEHCAAIPPGRWNCCNGGGTNCTPALPRSRGHDFLLAKRCGSWCCRNILYR